jgi:hypothetical protein
MGKEAYLGIVAAMKQVARYYEAGDVVLGYEFGKAYLVLRLGAAGYGYAVFAEMPAFAPVEIGHYQGMLCRPVQRPLGQQLYRFTLQFNF